jgi:hypothetical protein
MAEARDSFRSAARLAARLAAAAAIVAAVGALAHLPLGEAPAEAGLRVDVRARSAKLELCTERSPAELAALPAHMRQARDCRETAVDYRLRVAVDGAVLVDRPVAHRGVRRNRPLVAGELLRVPAGARRVEIEFTPIVPEGAGDAAGSLPSWRLDETVTLGAGRVAIAAVDDAGLRWLPPRPDPS